MPSILFDSDAFLLLAGAGLLDRTMELLGCRPDAARRLGALPFMIARSRPIRSRYSGEALRRAAADCDRVASLDTAPPAELLEVFRDALDVDEGEALLYASLANEHALLLTSNDKRAMHAVATSPALASIRRAVAGRVVAIETVVALLVHADGVAPTASAFAIVASADQALTAIFSRHNLTHPDSCREAIRSYGDHLRRQLGPDFLYTP